MMLLFLQMSVLQYGISEYVIHTFSLSLRFFPTYVFNNGKDRRGKYSTAAFFSAEVEMRAGNLVLCNVKKKG